MRDDLLAALAAREEKIELEGRKILVRELDAAADIAPFLDGEDSTWQLVVRSARDMEGKLIFGDVDIPELKKMSRTRSGPLIDAVLRVHGFGKDAPKNSAAAPSGG